MSRAVIFANGHLPHHSPLNLVRETDYLVAADGGLRNALSLGYCPQILIGDLDSVSMADLDMLEQADTQLIRYNPEKDETDLELAIAHVVESGHREIVIVAALGGRIDQTLGNIALLADVPPGVDIRLDDGVEEVFLITQRAEITGKPGDVVSLVPWGATVEGVTTDGLRYPLRGETLLAHKTRGISNEMLSEKAAVQLEKGTLICIHTRK